jgi:hypothetical protein
VKNNVLRPQSLLASVGVKLEENKPLPFALFEPILPFQDSDLLSHLLPCQVPHPPPAPFPFLVKLEIISSLLAKITTFDL